MQDPTNLSLVWWITVVEIPTLAGLFWLNWRTRRDLSDIIGDVSHEAETGLSFIRERLSAYKLEVAQNYVSISALKDVESRLTRHLTRIENKLDSLPTLGARSINTGGGS